MRIKQFKSAEGRDMLKVAFTPHDPEPDKVPVYEVVYELKQSGSTNLLDLVSATRQDTREAVSLTDEQRSAILEAAVEHLASQDDSPLWGDKES